MAKHFVRMAAQAMALLPLLLYTGLTQATVIGACDESTPLSASQNDRLIRFAALVKAELQASDVAAAVVARSGLSLGLFDQRYSHAGISLQDSSNGPWSVRQLYYACDEARPKVFDQGLTGFVLGVNDPDQSFVSLLLLPQAKGQALAQVALNNQRALGLLGSTYSANAYAFGLQYQNCNQWVIETLAVAWGDLAPTEDLRQQSQAWLRQQAYEPTRFDLKAPPIMWLSHLIPWVHHDDHPSTDLAQHVFRVSMPSSIETFVRQQAPDVIRVEFCLRDKRVVKRRGWQPMSSSCEPQEGDVVAELD
ncbi:MAG: DUF2145 domain-containing protein [Rhizobacter sp.]